MGTFHDTDDPLHGVTVVATAGDRVYVGRCHERSPATVVLLDADEHAEGQDGRTIAEYLDRAARFGVWKKHDRLVLDAADLGGLAPLSEFYRRPGEAAKPTVSVASPAPLPPAGAAPAEPAPSPESPVILTPAAADEVRRLLESDEHRGQGLRLGVAGGGCSGLVYKVEFSGEREGDLIVPQEGFGVYLDRKSAIYLRGVALDFQGGLGGKGFVFQNPNATNTCGCGESFAV